MFKSNAATTIYKEISGLCINVTTITPCPDVRRLVADLRIRIGIKKPEWHIHTFNLINMILVFENLRQKTLPGNMFHQSFFGCFLVQLKWDNQIRPKCTCKFSRENNRIVTKRTLGCRHRCISDDFSTAGLANIGT